MGELGTFGAGTHLLGLQLLSPEEHFVHSGGFQAWLVETTGLAGGTTYPTWDMSVDILI